MVGAPIADATFPGERALLTRDHELRFVLHDSPGSNYLVVVFSSFHLPHRPPPYRYTRVLRDVAVHRLYVLDDQGPDGEYPRPCWYLGRNRRFTVANAVHELIGKVAGELEVQTDHVITAGSSKGGYASVYFALTGGYGHAISGEPQTLLGSYLDSPTEGKREILRHIAGGTGKADIAYLDELLFDVARRSKHKPFVHMHCAEHGRYRERMVKPLLEVCSSVGIPYELHLGDYTHHDDLSEQFPPYLTGTIDQIVA